MIGASYIGELVRTEVLPAEHGISESEAGLVTMVKSPVGQLSKMNNVR